MSNLLKVSKIEIRKDKNDNPYKYIEVSNYPHKLVAGPDGTQVKVRQMSRTIAITAWDKREVGEFSFPKDPAFDLETGESFEAEIVTREVPSYEIPDNNGELKTVNTYTCVVFGSTENKESFHAAVMQEFSRRDHSLTEGAEIQTIERADVSEKAPELSTAKQAADMA